MLPGDIQAPPAGAAANQPPASQSHNTPTFSAHQAKGAQPPQLFRPNDSKGKTPPMPRTTTKATASPLQKASGSKAAPPMMTLQVPT